mmetsp:Transcript_13921/g.30789  ORF Transcript_13921/g.30789 Transcript_13921/m.30789 type:complete len:286 (+) Transcript_13921:1-858(+)
MPLRGGIHAFDAPCLCSTCAVVRSAYLQWLVAAVSQNLTANVTEPGLEVMCPVLGAFDCFLERARGACDYQIAWLDLSFQEREPLAAQCAAAGIDTDAESVPPWDTGEVELDDNAEEQRQPLPGELNTEVKVVFVVSANTDVVLQLLQELAASPEAREGLLPRVVAAMDQERLILPETVLVGSDTKLGVAMLQVDTARPGPPELSGLTSEMVIVIAALGVLCGCGVLCRIRSSYKQLQLVHASQAYEAGGEHEVTMVTDFDEETKPSRPSVGGDGSAWAIPTPVD